MTKVIDVTAYSHIIHKEAERRYINNQTTGIEGMTVKPKARVNHLRGVAGEVAARLSLELDPYEIYNDELHKPDIVHQGYKIDVKTVLAERPVVNVNYYDKVLDHKGDWHILVMIYEGIGWRFIKHGYLSYASLKDKPLSEPRGGHRSKFWSIDL